MARKKTSKKQDDLKPTMRAKMIVDEVTSTRFSDADCVKLSAVTDGTEEDNSYARNTPMANLEITINNPELRGTIKAGQTFYLDFIPTEDA